MLIDSHCHINFSAYKNDAQAVIGRALASDTWLINIGSQYSTSVRTIKIAENYHQGVYAVVGLHPIHLVDDITESVVIDGQKQGITTKREEFDYDKYKALAKSSTKVVGLGETGLDYFYFNEAVDTEAHKKIQRKVFTDFIKLGQELNLPLVIHARGSKNDHYGVYDDVLEILRATGVFFGVAHCFGGNLRQAQEFIKLGFYIGFTGLVTFKSQAEEVQSIVKELPLDKILIETDAPFLSPEPYRGQRNEPAYVKLVAQKVAELKNLPISEVSDATFNNAKNLFKF
ncbi:MAG: hypothetical protein A3B89_04195 [Candidatus Buchananbacteria bacterium RIFCSPHIGHO2_02_FULL_40_13]|uniref:Hydrolase TatD n=1 Tax=Candidatus Buchananbacteria bacterium RIFCSPLOWO2_01_FULL_39_33 TaxID=1797543 RepID=A0A1G1YKR7_9BACT|nr:MAG: hypothetical protein A2820_01900 [Candidatus Buchananbacteria bacterium RIFCSPHIGHO2_01_FULL_40_35]OGY50878.1 MAG: hypothetical protein A3B89_04195 [Candidatus Buchananbacteria bacterium RIFCSPHIGHO2_02_FULL_40_13]OGY52945.1 MAG: hypothetical protein A3A02_04370 [Candidatus Buchananbacteria bacterium RIFCSPLOWO2_01_FULL_39_33]